MKPICLLCLLLGVCLAACSRKVLPGAVTVTVQDTLIVRPAAHMDTLFQTRPADTIRWMQERLRIQLIRQHDTFRLAATCLPDTVRVPLVRVVQAPAPPNPTPPPQWPWLLAGALLMGLLLRALRA